MSGPYYASGGAPAAPRDWAHCKEESGYDAFFQNRAVPYQKLVEDTKTDYLYVRYQPYSTARQVTSYEYAQTFGRPMGSMMTPVTVVAPSYPWNRRNFVPPKGPLAIAAYVRAMAGDMLLDKHGRNTGKGTGS